MTTPLPTPRWMTRVLRAAAVYNLTYGAFMMAAPGALFAWTDMPPQSPVTLLLWQGVGALIAVWGVGYWLAARSPLVLWPITLMGLLGKAAVVLGMGKAVLDGVLPAEFLLLSIPNDLIWLPPFALILWRVWRAGRHKP